MTMKLFAIALLLIVAVDAKKTDYQFKATATSLRGTTQLGAKMRCLTYVIGHLTEYKCTCCAKSTKNPHLPR